MQKPDCSFFYKGDNRKEEICSKFVQKLFYLEKLYFEHYAFAYNTLISIFLKKPVKPLIELEAAFSHFMHFIRYLNQENMGDAEKNLDRFGAHIERMLLDLYKICFLNYLDITKELLEKEPFNKEFLSFHVKVSEAFYEARTYEIENIGVDKEDTLKKYKENLKKVNEEFLRLKGLVNDA